LTTTAPCCLSRHQQRPRNRSTSAKLLVHPERRDPPRTERRDMAAARQRSTLIYGAVCVRYDRRCGCRRSGTTTANWASTASAAQAGVGPPDPSASAFLLTA